MRYITILAVALLCGCVGVVDVTKTHKGFYDKSNPNEVEILKTIPARKYEELGTVTASGFQPRDTAKMHNAIRAKSSALGAHAVVLTDEGLVNDGWSVTKWGTGVAIRYKDSAQ